MNEINQIINKINMHVYEISSIPSDIDASINIYKQRLIQKIDENIGIMENLAESLQYGITLLTSAKQGEQQYPKEHIMDMGRALERELDDTITAITNLANLEQKEVKELGDLGIKYDGMRYLRRELLPSLLGLASVYAGTKDKPMMELGEKVADLRKFINMIRNGEPVLPKVEK